jgi:glycerol-3-phosphate cytidylyltransferase-like family protein
MFILDLFEAQQKQTLVIIPGGFHPFHPGHLSLYRSAESAFPGATIVYAATDDRKERPFAFADKQKLAQIAGVNPNNFQLVRSPFVCKEITQNFDPNTTVLIFARSEKDRNEQPKPGGVKKDGSPSYLQPYTKGNLAPMSQHGYMAYLPVVQFDAGPSGVTSATQIREMWPKANEAQKLQIVQDLYPKNPRVARQILDKYLGGAVAEDATMDPNAIQLKKRAKVAHPFAKSDEEALALYINDREIKDVDELEREQNRELRMITRIEQGEEKLSHQLQRIDQELALLSKSLKAK